MRTAGVDLAAQSAGTAVAIIEWTGDGPRATACVREVLVGVEDSQIVEAAATVEKVGIDCALGWPDEFVEFVASHSSLQSAGARVDGGMDWRRTLSFRETDRFVRTTTGRWPLSVSTDRLGVTAMRCAGLQARLVEGGIAVDRSGSGVIVEVYPGAALRLWGLPTRGYRAEIDARDTLLLALGQAAPWLDFEEFAPLMVSSADAFDAVIAALVARCAALGRYTPPPKEALVRARREGWIALPYGPLADLL
ncbi:MAG: DUF429 domain-containing protein [Microbacteriaceae bacterium]